MIPIQYLISDFIFWIYMKNQSRWCIIHDIWMRFHWFHFGNIDCNCCSKGYCTDINNPCFTVQYLLHSTHSYHMYQLDLTSLFYSLLVILYIFNMSDTHLIMKHWIMAWMSQNQLQDPDSCILQNQGMGIFEFVVISFVLLGVLY